MNKKTMKAISSNRGGNGNISNRNARICRRAGGQYRRACKSNRNSVSGAEIFFRRYGSGECRTEQRTDESGSSAELRSQSAEAAGQAQAEKDQAQAQADKTEQEAQDALKDAQDQAQQEVDQAEAELDQAKEG